MINLQIPNRLKISQKTDWIETVISGIETSNRYAISSDRDSKFLFAYEKCDFIWKTLIFIGAVVTKLRPCTIHFVDNKNHEQFVLHRKFHLFLSTHLLKVGETIVGTIKRNFSIFTIKYSLLDGKGHKIGRIERPFMKPWTYNVFDARGKQIGLIGKKFSGAKEFFSDADNFSFELDESIKDNLFRSLVLSATIAIDYDNFEN